MRGHYLAVFILIYSALYFYTYSVFTCLYERFMKGGLPVSFEEIIDAMKRFGSTERDIVINVIKTGPEPIFENVVLAPWWDPSSLPDLGEAELIAESRSSAVKVWNITAGDIKFSYIKTGIGAPVLMDVLLTLGLTKCKNVIFIGSVGSIDEKIGIGDIVIPEYSVCGDGASRYIATDDLKDCWGGKAYPDSSLLEMVKSVTEKVCREDNVNWYLGKVFSVDTIVAQFAHIDKIMNMDCNAIEMETASAFLAAKLANIAIAAVLLISDNTVAGKSLISGRNDKDMDYYRFVKSSMFPKIILGAFQRLGQS